MRPDTCVVRLLAQVWLRGRLLARRGPHGALLELSIADATRLVRNGSAEPLRRVAPRG